ncbi:MAG: SRPBCC domain-containing protein [Desulfosarcinaceae bacterium]|nr:SRPBCC domain-containing protein [Desulfosarcinaceae bacterium]
MNTTTTEVEAHTLTISRDFPADRKRMFQAWTDPEMLTRWFGPPGVTTLEAAVDLRAGGEYRLTMREPGGEIIVHGGVYREIVPPEKLVFTWVLAGQACEGSAGFHAETVVTLTFAALEKGTRLTLTHEFLPTEISRTAHAAGWEGSLTRLLETVA